MNINDAITTLRDADRGPRSASTDNGVRIDRDSSVNATTGAEAGHIQQTVFNENTKQWFVAVLMALSITVNVVLAVLLSTDYRAKTVAEDLKRYELDSFKSGAFADVKTQLEVTKELIAAKCGK